MVIITICHWKVEINIIYRVCVEMHLVGIFPVQIIRVTVCVVTVVGARGIRSQEHPTTQQNQLTHSQPENAH